MTGAQEYFEFSVYFIQTVILLLTAAFYLKGRKQKVIVGAALSFVVGAALIKDSLSLTHLNDLEFTICLYGAYALIPLLFFSSVTGKDEVLEKLVSIQQTWLRLSFLAWVLSQGVNITHYELNEIFAQQFGLIALGIIIVGLILRKLLFWTLLQQSILSLFVLVVELHSATQFPYLVFTWVLLLGMAVLFPKITAADRASPNQVLKRLEFGALGGGVFWSGILAIQLWSQNHLATTTLWTAVVFIVGLLSWLQWIAKSDPTDRARFGWVFSLRIAIQLSMLLLFAIPTYVGLGGL